MIGKCNPLNIRRSTHFMWAGQTGETRGFCDFEDVAMCRRAGAYLLMRAYRKAGCKQVSTVINRWAPTCENDTKRYIDYVCKRTGFHPHTQLCFDSDYASVLAAMEIFEQGIELPKRETYFATAKASYLYIIEKFNLKKYEN